MVKALLLALIGLSALPAAATECGLHHTDLVKPFAGRWQDDKGNYYEIAPGKVTRQFGKEVRKYHFGQEIDADDSTVSVLDCHPLAPAERDTIGKDMANLAAIVTRSGNTSDIELFNKSLAHPPYPVLAFTHYDDSQWLILKDKSHLVDVWFGRGQFSVRTYNRH